MSSELTVVTGSEGFLGRKVVQALSGTGCQILAADRVPHRGEAGPGVTYHQADLSDPSSLLPETFRSAPFSLIHLAWDMRRYDGYQIQGEQIRQFSSLLDYWSGSRIERIMGMGSAEEYGHMSGKLSEHSRPEFPLSPYGWAKRASRDLAQSWSLRTGIPVTWMRPFIMYGEGQKGDMVIPYALDCVKNRKTADFSDGLQRRDFVFIDDVVDAMMIAIGQKPTGFNEFNLGRGEEVAVADIINAIAEMLDGVGYIKLGSRPRRIGEPDVQVADSQRALQNLGWEAKTPWRDGIRRVCEHVAD